MCVRVFVCLFVVYFVFIRCGEEKGMGWGVGAYYESIYTWVGGMKVWVIDKLCH